MRPLDLLQLNLDGEVQIQIKKNQRLVGTLAGFDEHLNLIVKNAKNECYVQGNEEIEQDELDEEDESMAGSNQPQEISLVKQVEDVGSIILRGDNVIFLRFLNPIINRPKKEEFQRKKSNYRPRSRYPRQRYGQRSSNYKRGYRDNRSRPYKKDNRPYPKKRD
ncbi:MAG: LSM domain-containing protein [Promethearchaeota archaeon]